MSAPTTPSELKKLSLQELMDIEVTTVSRRPTKLSETASAVQVITAEDIHRSGATTVPEALRLAANLQVAQVNAHDWAITARGFNGAPLANNSLADKLLVMIDGRSIYTPLFGGVFWDIQNLPLDLVDRIEVVSGPGGTLWGANAVNGIVNIVTKSADDTQGVAISAAAGSIVERSASARYGGTHGRLAYRIYGMRLDRDNSLLADGRDALDDWNMTQGGFRIDYRHSATSSFTIQGDAYAGSEGMPQDAELDGQDILARWTRAPSADSEWIAQVYFDRTWRYRPDSTFGENLRTFDVDLQHRTRISRSHVVTGGLGFRYISDSVDSSPGFVFDPAVRSLRLASGFLQDEMSFAGGRARLTLGAKLEHNDFSGLEIQPSARMIFNPDDRHALWAAISRAVRSPSRIDSDLITRSVAGNPQFDAENVVAYELGYRIRAGETAAISLAAFYNDYDDLRSVDVVLAPTPHLQLGNHQTARYIGIELSSTIRPTPSWRLRGGFTHLSSHFHSTIPTVYPGSDRFEAADPANQIVLQSMLDLPGGVRFDVVGRYVARLPASPITQAIPSYTSFDARLARRFERWELALVGQNLADPSHAEFGSAVVGREIPRAVFASVGFDWSPRGQHR